MNDFLSIYYLTIFSCGLEGLSLEIPSEFIGILRSRYLPTPSESLPECAHVEQIGDERFRLKFLEIVFFPGF